MAARTSSLLKRNREGHMLASYLHKADIPCGVWILCRALHRLGESAHSLGSLLMACFRYKVYEFDTQGYVHDSGKEFTTTSEECNAWRAKRAHAASTDIDTRFLLLDFFMKVFKFDKESGYALT